MSFYLLQFGIFLIYSLFFYLIRPVLNRLYYIVTGAHLITIIGLRSFRVGTDTFSNVYSYTSNNPFNIRTGTPVYSLLSKVIYDVSGGNYHAFLFIIAAITVSIVLYCIYRFQPTIFEGFLAIYLYITFYYYFDAFNTQRQMLAVAISMLVPIFLLQNNKIKAVISLLLAIGIHNTAIVIILYFLICKVKKCKKNLYLISILATIFVYFSSYFFNIFASVSEHYEMYVGTNEYSSKGGSIVMGLFILFFVIIVSNKNSEIYLNNKASVAMYISCVAGLIYVIGGKSTLIIRMANYFGMFVPVFISMVPRIVSQRFRNQRLIKLSLTMLVLIASFTVMYYKLSQNIDGIIPYSM